MSNMFLTKEFAEKWDEHQTSREDVLRTRIMNPIILKEIGSLGGKSVLEVGCGNGFFIKHLISLNPKHIASFDISKHFIELTRKRYPQVELKQGDVMKRIPFSDNQFDCVTCYSVINDIQRISKAVSEMRRVAKKGGYIHIIIVHPLYNLFINDPKAKDDPLIKRLSKYLKVEAILVDTIPGYPKFKVYRRPLSDYINEFIKNNLEIEKMVEVPVNQKAAKANNKYLDRLGVPVFAYFKLKKN